MRTMMQVFFGAFVGNVVLATVGFMGPAPYWPGVGGAVLAAGSFAVMVLLDRVDRNTRYKFTRILAQYRNLPEAHDFHPSIDTLQARIAKRDPLVEISHEMGVLRGKLIAAGKINANHTVDLESSV